MFVDYRPIQLLTLGRQTSISHDEQPMYFGRTTLLPHGILPPDAIRQPNDLFHLTQSAHDDELGSATTINPYLAPVVSPTAIETAIFI